MSGKEGTVMERAPGVLGRRKTAEDASPSLFSVNKLGDTEALRRIVAPLHSDESHK